MNKRVNKRLDEQAQAQGFESYAEQVRILAEDAALKAKVRSEIRVVTTAQAIEAIGYEAFAAAVARGATA